MIDRATVDKILEATDIVDVVGEFVNLRKAGVNYKGLCPFHDDKTPSFMVSPARQICKCFACGEGGNAVNFLMKHEQITYPEALRWLAKKYNIEIQERELTDDEKREQSDRESMFVVNEWACQYFHEILKNDVDGIAVGKQYFRSRGIRDDIIEKFRLGFALTKRDAMCNEAKRKGYQDEFLVKTGLAIQNERGIYDRFAGRAMFPWLNVSGKVVAFGGRKLDAATKGVLRLYGRGLYRRDCHAPVWFGERGGQLGYGVVEPSDSAAASFHTKYRVAVRWRRGWYPCGHAWNGHVAGRGHEYQGAGAARW